MNENQQGPVPWGQLLKTTDLEAAETEDETAFIYRKKHKPNLMMINITWLILHFLIVTLFIYYL